jgi:hypothetical protein
MDIKKAHRLLNKIQAFLDDGHGQELSRLEKDLIKSYIQQLYDAVTTEANDSTEEPSKITESPKPRHTIEEPVKKESQFQHSEPVRPATNKPIYQEYVAPVEKPVIPPPVFTEMPSPVMNEKVEDLQSKVQEPVHVQETSTYAPQVNEPLKHGQHHEKNVHTTTDPQEALNKLFDQQKSDDSSVRFGHVPIPSIESAMGLNERIFTLNELFGGDKVLFDAWCTRLNNLHSFSEARQVLMSGPAKDFRWGDPERIKMAEQFIRIVSRRYPKSLS